MEESNATYSPFYLAVTLMMSLTDLLQKFAVPLFIQYMVLILQPRPLQLQLRDRAEMDFIRAVGEPQCPSGCP